MRNVITICAAVAAQVAMANEMFDVSPKELQLSGTDAYGRDAYEITASIEHSESTATLTSLRVQVHGSETEVDLTTLPVIADPDFGSVFVVNDIGINGSFFYIRIPFGEVGKCRKARREGLRFQLAISTEQEGSVRSVRIEDPCNAV